MPQQPGSEVDEDAEVQDLEGVAEVGDNAMSAENEGGENVSRESLALLAEESDGEEPGSFMVHVKKVPPSCTLDDVSSLFKHLGGAFCYRVSDSVVAAEFETASAAQAAVRLSGTVLTAPQCGHIKFTGEAVEIVASTE
mmetsp:Transcript_92254/g.162755  ORF Transcript_92254/g.162755 Transcript_92254/m.162755 type:complete len:139 (+) Transcript_92254:99-515(+)